VPALRQHFSRYGSIRASFHLESNGKHSDKGVVVFDVSVAETDDPYPNGRILDL